jgi:hypothetical protein
MVAMLLLLEVIMMLMSTHGRISVALTILFRFNVQLLASHRKDRYVIFSCSEGRKHLTRLYPLGQPSETFAETFENQQVHASDLLLVSVNKTQSKENWARKISWAHVLDSLFEAL